jgi:hypothetical protein
MRWWIFICLFLVFGFSQEVIRGQYQDNDSLYMLFFINKDFDSLILIPAMSAIRSYEELRNTHIEFRYKNIRTLMAARPSADFILKKRENRKYIVVVCTDHENSCHQTIRNMSPESRAGILGHEFSHILTYENKSGLGMIGHAVHYAFHKKSIERKTDRITIERGLGKEILSFNHHIRECNFLSKRYLKRKNKNYLSVTEIETLLENI